VCSSAIVNEKFLGGIRAQVTHLILVNGIGGSLEAGLGRRRAHHKLQTLYE
jgi:hypothetical protein